MIMWVLNSFYIMYIRFLIEMYAFSATNIQSMTRATLMNYLSNYHSPERMVIAGVGVDHDELVEITQVRYIYIYI